MGRKSRWLVEVHTRDVRTTIQKFFYRNGQLREVLPLRNGQRHGVARVWHKNGRLASEERHANGLLHGRCRQWSEPGSLLGKYKMVYGTGIQRAWHDNGRLQMEISTLAANSAGEVVKLHYFVGLTHAESAEILQVSEKTVRRHWNYARVWLHQTIQSADQPSNPLG